MEEDLGYESGAAMIDECGKLLNPDEDCELRSVDHGREVWKIVYI